MTRSIMDLVAEAKAAVPAISPAEAKEIMARDDVLVVDVREDREVAKSGKVKGALHRGRGMLEFYADPAAPFYDPLFTQDKTVILYCASGGRSALAGVALRALGFTDVRNLGSFKGWVDAGGEIEPAAD